MSTRVCITVDTEFSIGGAFQNAARVPTAGPMVWCEVDGQSQGLGFMLSTFDTYRIPATFFVETLHRHYFQDDPMRPIVLRIRAHQHEVQLHAHPCWSVFRHPDWRERVRDQPRQDNSFGRTEDELVEMIRQGIEIFDDWGLPAPQLFRSGSLQHDDTLYRALARAGIPYSSNVGLAMFNSGDPRYQLYSGRHLRHGVAEFPVLTYSDWRVGARRHLKLLTIAGASFSETRTLLERAHRAGVAQVVILTHPFEYIQSRGHAMRHLRRHSVTQSRLTRLCEFLDSNRDRFVPSGLAEAAHVASPLGQDNLLLDGTLWQTVGRMATQVSYDGYGKCALALAQGRPA